MLRSFFTTPRISCCLFSLVRWWSAHWNTFVVLNCGRFWGCRIVYHLVLLGRRLSLHTPSCLAIFRNLVNKASTVCFSKIARDTSEARAITNVHSCRLFAAGSEVNVRWLVTVLRNMYSYSLMCEAQHTMYIEKQGGIARAVKKGDLSWWALLPHIYCRWCSGFGSPPPREASIDLWVRQNTTVCYCVFLSVHDISCPVPEASNDLLVRQIIAVCYCIFLSVYDICCVAPSARLRR